MIEQAQNIGVTGDMSRTIDTASNGVRVLEARIQQFTRAIGNMLMPMLSAILPYQIGRASCRERVFRAV